MWLNLFGVSSGILIIIADIPYVINAYRGKTHPHRVTWFIIFILNVISFANQLASGATHSLWLIIGGMIATLAVFLVSIPKGTGGLAKLDLVVLAGAILGLFLWWVLGTPLASIIAGVVVSMIALIPTFKKAYIDPSSETKITWLLGTISCLLATFSVGKLDYTLLILPFYSFLANLCLYVLLEIRTKIPIEAQQGGQIK